jgi:hypothetical protein
MRPCLVLLAFLPALASGCAATAGSPSTSLLLSAADLPAGFQPAQPPADPPGTSDPPACGAAMDRLKVTGDAAARADFTDTAGVSRIGEILRKADVSQVTAARTALAQCPSYTVTAAGTRYEMSTAIVDTTPTGFTATVRRHTPADDDVYEILIVDQVSTTTMVLSYAAPAQPDLTTVSSLAGTAAARLR